MRMSFQCLSWQLIKFDAFTWHGDEQWTTKKKKFFKRKNVRVRFFALFWWIEWSLLRQGQDLQRALAFRFMTIDAFNFLKPLWKCLKWWSHFANVYYFFHFYTFYCKRVTIADKNGQTLLLFKNKPFAASFSLFSSFQYSWQ